MEFSEQFIKVMNAVGNKIGIAMDWSQVNMQPYVEQLSHGIVNYEIATSIMWLVVYVLAIIAFVFILKYIWKAEEMLIFSALCILVAVLSLGGLEEVVDIITAVTLPEKTLFEFMMDIKGSM